jgi:hypothetical protein
LPRSVSVVINATADVLEHHMQALDLLDPSSEREHEAYASLVKRHRALARELDATAAEMNSYRGLPMGRHDMHKMMAPESREVFTRFIAAESELKHLLQEKLERDLSILRQMP